MTHKDEALAGTLVPVLSKNRQSVNQTIWLSSLKLVFIFTRSHSVCVYLGLPHSKRDFLTTSSHDSKQLTESIENGNSLIPHALLLRL